MLVKLEVVTAVPCRAKVLAVTVPLIAGSEPMVTVPEMAGSELTVTVVLARVTPWVGTVANETGWVAWKNVPLTGTVPLMDAVTEPRGFVPAGSGEIMFTGKLSLVKKSKIPSSIAVRKLFPAIAVTVPEMVGSEPMVTLLPTVTEPAT